MHSSTLPPDTVADGSLRALREARRRQDAAQRAAAIAVRDGAGVVDAAAYPVAVTPRYDGAMAPLPRERRRAFREHLRRVVDLAFATDAPIAATEIGAIDDKPSSDAADAVLGGACATCAGFCCTRGGVRAFLTPDTIRRWRAMHPSATARGARHAYLAHLRAESHDGSCVYHGPMGCTLPRALRSDTCNRYFCGALAELRRAGAQRAFVAAADGESVARGRFLDAERDR